MRCTLVSLALTRPLAIPLVLVFSLTTAFLAPFDPLNFLFFCLCELATLGIVDNIFRTKTIALQSEDQWEVCQMMADQISEVIVSDDGQDQFQDVLVADELGLGVFGVGLVLEVLAEVKVLGLDDHLLVVEVDLDVLHGRAGQLYLVGDFLAAVGRWVAAAEAEEHVLGAYLLAVERFEVGLLPGVVLYDWQIRHFLLAPDLVFCLYFGLGFAGCLFWLFGLGLVLFADLCLDLGVGLGNLLLLALCADGSGVEHAALEWIFDEVGVFLAGDEVLEGHKRAIVEH